MQNLIMVNSCIFQFLLVAILLGVCIVCCRADIIYHVTPNSSASCHEATHECHTLLFYVQNARQYFVSDTRFIFLPGNHSLDVGELVLIQNEANLTLIGNDTLLPVRYNEAQWLESTSRIVCSNFSGFAFANISRLSITNLTFVSCGAYISDDWADTVFHVHTHSLFFIGANGLKVSLFLVNISSLEFSQLCVRNGRGYGVLGINVVGRSSISGCTFVRNNDYTLKPTPGECYEIECQGGNALFVYGDPFNCFDIGEHFSLSIQSGSLFAYGVDQSLDLMETAIRRGSGLGFKLGQSTFGLQVNITNVTSIGNVAKEGANLYFSIFDSVSNLDISMVNVHSMNGTAVDVYSGTGVGLWCHYGTPHPDILQLCTLPTMYTSQIEFSVRNSWFTGNYGNTGVGVYIDLWAPLASRPTPLVNFTDCIISNNVGTWHDMYMGSGISRGIGLLISERLNKDSLVSSVVLQDTMVTNNSFIHPVDHLPKEELDGLFSITAFLGVQNVRIIGCDFSDNKVTALYAFESNLYFSGNVTFMGNIGISGGGVVLDSSVMYLQEHTTMTFTYNRARLTGGAIYVVTHANDPLSHTCFFQIDTSPFLSLEQLDIRVLFWENHAGLSGSVLYGGWIDRCNLITGPAFAKSGTVFNSTFHIERQSSNTSVISSEPNFVCMCDSNHPACGYCYDFIGKSVYPGQKFSLPVVAVGQRQGISVPADVVLLFDTDAPVPTRFGNLENPQTTDITCKNLSYSISSPNKFETAHFKVQNAVLLEWPCRFNITLKECPPGFQLSNESFQCDCTPLLNVSCNITDQTLERASNVWIAALNGKFVISDPCPFDYCTPFHKSSPINPRFPNSQCAFHRSGILCGNCSSNNSLVLGSSQCRKCSNSFIALLTAFALAGLALVFFLMFFNLTVSVGTINGLIFYANIVGVNYATFFPEGKINLLTVFVSWLNLDLGIETCFYVGMDSYAKAWLQFAFPIYIWLIIGCIIILSRYSVVVSRLCGSNSVPVLATLMLLSFTKIMSAVITALQFGILVYEDGHRETVWRYDGNIRYFSARHSVLFVCALAFLIPSILYILFLLFSQWLLAKATPRNALRYIAKLKPIVDAYHGPYKDKYRYWTGFMLLVRGILFLIFSTTFEIKGVNQLVIAVSVYVLIALHWGGRGVYKKNWMNVLEFSFILNLGILTTATLFNGLESGKQAATAYTSVGIALLTAVGILAYHAHAQVRRKFKCAQNVDIRASSCCREAEPLLENSDETDPLLHRDLIFPPAPHRSSVRPHPISTAVINSAP